MIIALVMTYSIFLVPALALMWLVAKLSRNAPAKIRTPLLVIAACLLLAPSLGPATIVVVPVPFGLLFGITLATWSWSDLADWIMQYPLWHAISFPVTALIAYLVIRKLRSNNSFKPSPLRGLGPTDPASGGPA